MASPVQDPPLDYVWRFECFNQLFWFFQCSIILLKPIPRKPGFESHVCTWQYCLWNFSFFSLQEKILWPSIWITWRLLRWCSSWFIPTAQYGQALWPFESQIPGSNPGRSTTQQKYNIDWPTHYLQISSIFNLFNNLPRRFLSYYFKHDVQWMSRSCCMQKWTLN